MCVLFLDFYTNPYHCANLQQLLHMCSGSPGSGHGHKKTKVPHPKPQNFEVYFNNVSVSILKPAVALTVGVASLRSWGLDFEPLSTCGINIRWVDSACHPSEVGEMSTS